MPARTPADRLSSPARRHPLRSLLAAAGVLFAAVSIALVGTGTSYALWNTTTTANAATVNAGSTGITVNGQANFVIAGLDTTKLGPGLSVVAPVTIKNTGTTKLSVTATGTTVTGTNLAAAQALAAELALTITPSATCTAGLGGGTTGQMPAFSTTAYPVVVQPGAELPLCLEVKMGPDAPTTVQGSTLSFTINIAGAQVR